jgi:hypothetical protein
VWNGGGRYAWLTLASSREPRELAPERMTPLHTGVLIATSVALRPHARRIRRWVAHRYGDGGGRGRTRNVAASCALPWRLSFRHGVVIVHRWRSGRLRGQAVIRCTRRRGSFSICSQPAERSGVDSCFACRCRSARQYQAMKQGDLSSVRGMARAPKRGSHPNDSGAWNGRDA